MFMATSMLCVPHFPWVGTESPTHCLLLCDWDFRDPGSIAGDWSGYNLGYGSGIIIALPNGLSGGATASVDTPGRKRFELPHNFRQTVAFGGRGGFRTRPYITDNDNPMNMVGHDHKRIQLNMGYMIGQIMPCGPK
ncbi:MAG: hypothetical protein JRI31_09450 [Deltaproteobacteria bacterium]|nr:hypothetical protein [Deltaproteobacteria bacterium]